MSATDEGSTASTWSRAFGVGPVLWAWVVAVGVDLFYNAGVLSPLLKQDREPSLLSDAALVARIPIAYLALAVGVAALAWLMDVLEATGAPRGATVGAAMGLVFGFTGTVGLWTAIDVTLLFVGAGVLVQVSQLAATGAVLGAVRSGMPRARLRRRCLMVALVGIVIAAIAQNVVA